MYTDLYMASDMENLRLNPMAKEFVPPGTFRKAPFAPGFHQMGPGSQVCTCGAFCCLHALQPGLHVPKKGEGYAWVAYLCGVFTHACSRQARRQHPCN